MSGDVHVRFCERLGVRFPRATHLCNYCGDFQIDYTRLHFRAEKTVEKSSVLRIDDKQVLEVVDRKLDLVANG